MTTSMPQPICVPLLTPPAVCSLAMLEMQIVASLFFRYFDVKLDPAMKAEDMKMRIAFSGNPSGEKVLLKLQKVSS